MSLPFSFFFFNDTATTEIYTLSLHDALPISKYLAATRLIRTDGIVRQTALEITRGATTDLDKARAVYARSEEHTSELQSLAYLVCRLLLEKKKKQTQEPTD